MSTPSAILGILERHRDAPISGEVLAGMLSISRSAVCEAIHRLKTEGYAIQATPNQGYQLAPTCDRLSSEGIRAWLPEAWQANDITVYPTIDSTNTQMRRIISSGARHGTIIAAERQTAGRGRSGKTFYSPAYTGLYLSVLLRPEQGIALTGQTITIGVAVAVCRAIESLYAIHPKIKWVNDLYLNGRKISGILTESVGDIESGRIESVIVGVGINCTTTDYPESLATTAGALSPTLLYRNPLAAAIADGILSLSTDASDADLLSAYRARSLMAGRAITFIQNGIAYEATAQSIDDQGNLVVTLANGESRALFSGEVSLRGSF